MSLAALMTGRRSTRFTLWRYAASKGADGATVKTWTQRGEVTGYVDSLTAETAGRVFGLDVQVSLVLLVPLAADVLDKDGLIATTGPHAGKRFKIAKRRPVAGRSANSRAAHAECALEETPEVFDA